MLSQDNLSYNQLKVKTHSALNFLLDILIYYYYVNSFLPHRMIGIGILNTY